MITVQKEKNYKKITTDVQKKHLMNLFHFISPFLASDSSSTLSFFGHTGSAEINTEIDILKGKRKM